MAQPINTSKLPHKHSSTTATMDKVFFDGFRIRSFASVLRIPLAMNSSFGLGGPFHRQIPAVCVPCDLAVDHLVPLFHQPARLRIHASGELRIQSAILA